MAAVTEIVYRKVLRLLLFRLEPETAHRVTLAWLAMLPAIARSDDQLLATRLWDLDFSNPVGLAAGLDKEARAIAAWQTLGFGFVEIGTITPEPQPGNERPRMWRLPAHRALINRLGFPSAGMAAISPRLESFRRRNPGFRIGLNFGPNKNTPPARVADDYAQLIMRLGHLADFIVINVSSPNTPGLREWQAPAAIGTLLAAINVARGNLPRHPPVLVKLAPDLDQEAVVNICAAVEAGGVDGFVAGNTTLARAEVGLTDDRQGGLSGEPLRERARSLIRMVYRASGGRLPIIGVGGIMSAADAWEHIQAGASMVELYTGFIYEGPALIGAIKHGLLHLMKSGGWRSISEAAGSASR